MAQQILRTIVDPTHIFKVLTAREQLVAASIMTNNLAVKESERLIIITDTNMAENIAAFFFEAAKPFTNKITFIEMEPATENAQEPPARVSLAMKNTDVALLITTYSLSHTQARLAATSSGVRIASMPGISMDTILRTLSSDYRPIAKLAKSVAGVLTAASYARLTSPNGTEVVFDLSGRSAYADTGLIHNPGDFDNLPAGEAFVAPLEGKTEGVLVFDGCFADIVLDVPVKILIEKGRVVDISGGEAARLLGERLARVGPRGYNVAELGVGTNPDARLDSGSILEVEKVFGTVHVALGNNATIGGEVDVPFHSDGVILSPTLKVDNTVILDEGEFQL